MEIETGDQMKDQIMTMKLKEIKGREALIQEIMKENKNGRIEK